MVDITIVNSGTTPIFRKPPAFQSQWFHGISWGPRREPWEKAPQEWFFQELTRLTLDGYFNQSFSLLKSMGLSTNQLSFFCRVII
jgi:hypothetical protein